MRGRDGAVHERQMVRHPGSVVIVPVLGEAPGVGLVLLRQSRFAVEQTLVEFPAGTLERGEDPAACAARELEEETGYAAATLRLVGRFFIAPGLSYEQMWAFTAAGLRLVGARPEPDEELETTVHPAAEVLGMIDRGELIDAKSIAAMFLAQRAGIV